MWVTYVASTARWVALHPVPAPSRRHSCNQATSLPFRHSTALLRTCRGYRCHLGTINEVEINAMVKDEKDTIETLERCIFCSTNFYVMILTIVFRVGQSPIPAKTPVGIWNDPTEVAMTWVLLLSSAPSHERK